MKLLIQGKDPFAAQCNVTKHLCTTDAQLHVDSLCAAPFCDCWVTCLTCRLMNEIVADKHRGVMLRFSNGDMVQLSLCMDIEAAVDKLAHLASLGKQPS